MTRVIKKVSKRFYKGILLGILGIFAFFFRFQNGEQVGIAETVHADDTGPGGSGGGSGGSGDGSGPSGCSGGSGSGPGF